MPQIQYRPQNQEFIIEHPRRKQPHMSATLMDPEKWLDENIVLHARSPTQLHRQPFPPLPQEILPARKEPHMCFGYKYEHRVSQETCGLVFKLTN